MQCQLGECDDHELASPGGNTSQSSPVVGAFLTAVRDEPTLRNANSREPMPPRATTAGLADNTLKSGDALATIAAGMASRAAPPLRSANWTCNVAPWSSPAPSEFCVMTAIATAALGRRICGRDDEFVQRRHALVVPTHFHVAAVAVPLWLSEYM